MKRKWLSGRQVMWFVFGAIVVVAILALLWWVIVYCESKFPMQMAWNVVRVAFVVLVVFFLIAVLLAMIGYPIVRFDKGSAVQAEESPPMVCGKAFACSS